MRIAAGVGAEEDRRHPGEPDAHPAGARPALGLAALTCRRPPAPLCRSTCVPAPGAAAADPGSCPAGPWQLLPGSEAAAPSGKLPASSQSRALSRPRVLLLRGRRLPSSRQGAPESRGVCTTCTGSRGQEYYVAGEKIRLGVGVPAERQVKGVPAVSGRHEGPGGPSCLVGTFTPDCQTSRTRLGAASSTLPSPSSGRTAQGGESRRLFAFCTRVERPGGGGADSPPGRRGRGRRGVNKLPSCCPWVSKAQGQASVRLSSLRTYPALFNYLSLLFS